MADKLSICGGVCMVRLFNVRYNLLQAICFAHDQTMLADTKPDTSKDYEQIDCHTADGFGMKINMN